MELEIMDGACLRLFEYAVRQITTADVAAFAPSDPGYPNYVREFTHIVETGKLPSNADFDITETIGLTRWTDAADESDPTRFRRFRIFTNSVGLALCVAGVAGYDMLPPNYFAISLIDDAHVLGDAALFALLDPAFDEFHTVLVGDKSEESPFLLLARILIALMHHVEDGQASHLAERLMAEESQHFGTASEDFLWGCTLFGQLNSQWKDYVERFLLPSNPTLKLLRDALLT